MDPRPLCHELLAVLIPSVCRHLHGHAWRGRKEVEARRRHIHIYGEPHMGIREAGRDEHGKSSRPRPLGRRKKRRRGDEYLGADLALPLMAAA
ncbi:unnamed protein product [Urochloa humidicola]